MPLAVPAMLDRDAPAATDVPSLDAVLSPSANVSAKLSMLDSVTLTLTASVFVVVSVTEC
jgi:hypothetical protein